jgi:cytochrome b561
MTLTNNNNKSGFSEEERKQYAKKFRHFGLKYIYWLTALLFITTIFLPSFNTEFLNKTFFYLEASILFTIGGSMLSLVIYFNVLFIKQVFQRKPRTPKDTLQEIVKDLMDSSQKGYKAKKIILWILYLCLALSTITYTIFSIVLLCL